MRGRIILGLMAPMLILAASVDLWAVSLVEMKRRADEGEAAAQLYLGITFSRDLGVSTDKVEAVKWLLKAAEQGLAAAHFRLGEIYEDDRAAPQSYREALKWYRLAAEQGLGDAQCSLGIMYADGKGCPRTPLRRVGGTERLPSRAGPETRQDPDDRAQPG